MPQYYDLNANVGTAFSQGLMSGFEFVDRIKARRRQYELEERNQKRADDQFGLTKDTHEFNKAMATNADNRAANADARANTAADQQTDQFNYEKGQRATVEKRAAELHNSNMEDAGLRRDVTREALNTQRETRAAAAANARMIVEASQPQQQAAAPADTQPSLTQPSLTQVGLTTPATPQQAPASTGPVDLRAAQRDRDNSPGFLQSIMSLGNERSKANQARMMDVNAKDYWRGIANPGKETMGRGRQAAEARRDPLSVFDDYVDQRNKHVDAADRPALDNTMRAALFDKGREVREKIAALDPTDAKNTNELRALNREKDLVSQRLDTLAKAAVTNSARDHGITQSVKPSDPRVLQAVTNGAAQYAGQLPGATETEMRALNTQLQRISGSRRLTPKQVDQLAKGHAYGVVSQEALANWSRYGTPFAPAQPKIESIGAGGSIMMYPDGRQVFIEPGGGDKATGTKLRQGINDAASDVESMIKAGQIDLPEGSGRAFISESVSLLQSNAQAYQQQTGIRAVGADGRVDLSEVLAPQNIRVLINWRAKVAAGNTDPREDELPIDGAENAAAAIPQTGVAQPGTIVMGYRFLGGDPTDRRNYTPE